MKLALLFVLAALCCFAQAAQSHSVTLAWTDTANPTGTTYNAYRLTGACPATPPTLTALGGFTAQNASPVATTSYADSAVTGGTTYCYFVTAVSGTNQSAPSQMLAVVVPSEFAPSLTIAIAK